MFNDPKYKNLQTISQVFLAENIKKHFEEVLPEKCRSVKSRSRRDRPDL